MKFEPRKDDLKRLEETDLDQDPVKQFDNWFRDAATAGIDLANAMTLATANQQGLPSARMVLLKAFDAHGFVFYTNYQSPKARDLAENPNAALVFYWRELERQVRIEGTVRKVSQEESERYFRTRPRESQAAAWASKQSENLSSRQELEEPFKMLMKQYHGRDIPLPPHWGGYRVFPNAFEFWEGRPNRLHDRFRYTRQPDGTWRLERLAP